MQEQGADKLISLAAEKQNLIECFLKLTQDQEKALKNNSCKLILDTINKKQLIIERVNLLNLELEDAAPEDNDSLRIINMKTKAVISEAIALDNSNIKLLKKNQTEILEKLKQARKNKTTHDTYRGKSMAIEGILLDYTK